MGARALQQGSVAVRAKLENLLRTWAASTAPLFVMQRQVVGRLGDYSVNDTKYAKAIFNKDFLSLVIQYPQHKGIILAAENS